MDVGRTDPGLPAARGIPGWTPAKARLLSKYSHEIWSRLESDPKKVDSALDHLHTTVRMYYAGTKPTSLAALEGEALAEGVRIEWVRTRFTIGQLDAASTALAAALQQEEIEWHSISQTTPEGGIAAGLTVALASVDTYVEARVEALASTLAPGVPVVLVKSEGRAVPASGRRAGG